MPVLSFPAGIVGFPQARRFLLVRAEEEPGDPVAAWFVLRSLDDPRLSFAVADPSLFFPDYAPLVDDVTAERLGMTDETAAEQALLLVVVTLGDRVEESTANLFAPLVVHRTTRVGVQAVLTGSRWSLRQPLLTTD
jgi:flagellar assembly factor FliW